MKVIHIFFANKLFFMKPKTIKEKLEKALGSVVFIRNNFAISVCWHVSRTVFGFDLDDTAPLGYFPPHLPRPDPRTASVCPVVCRNKLLIEQSLV